MKLWRVFLFLVATPIYAQVSPGQLDQRMDRIEQRVNRIEVNTNEERSGIERVEQKVNGLESRIGSPPVVDEGGLACLCGLVCAYWAQNTRRNAWLWFFFGLFGTVIAFIVLLFKNSNDIQMRDDAERRKRMFPGSGRAAQQ